MRRSIRLLLIVMAFLSMILGCTQEQIELPKEVVIATGPSGGTWFSIGKLLEQLYTENLVKTVSVPGGGVQNVTNVNLGHVEMGFSAAVLGKAAIEGIEPFTFPQTGVTSIGTLYKQYLYCITTEDFAYKHKIETIDELFALNVPLRIAFLNKGTVSEFVCKHIIDHLGTSYEQIEADNGKVEFGSYNSGAIHLVEGQIDAFLFMASSPADIVLDLSKQLNISILTCSPKLRESMHHKLGTTSHELKKHTYNFLPHDTHVIGDYTVLLVVKPLPVSGVYALTKTLFKNTKMLSRAESVLKQINPKNAFMDTGFPLHPGAEQYYKDCGVWQE